MRDLRLEVTARFHLEGSVLRGTLAGGPRAFDARLEIDADEPSDSVAELVRVAESSCYVVQSLRTPVTLSVVLNGKPL